MDYIYFFLPSVFTVTSIIEKLFVCNSGTSDKQFHPALGSGGRISYFKPGHLSMNKLDSNFKHGMFLNVSLGLFLLQYNFSVNGWLDPRCLVDGMQEIQ